MIKTMLAVTAALLVVESAEAQDYTGNVDPSAYSLPTVMHSAIDARAKSRGRVSRNGLSPEAARVCANLPRTRARLGASDPRVREITQLCREAGVLR